MQNIFKKQTYVLTIAIIAFLLSGCTITLESTTKNQSVSFSSHLLNVSAQPCEDRFVSHELDHVTLPMSEPIRMFESNGAGVAINDLDDDGDLDIVLANLNGPASLFWNEGALSFDRQSIEAVQRSRAVNIVDTDGDGQLELIFTNGTGAPIQLKNGDDGHWSLASLPGVLAPAYAINWADWDRDNDLDFAIASYDAGLMLEKGDAFLFSDGGGVWAYENQSDGYVGQRLSDEAQGLAIALADLDGDDRPDLLVGNDFDLPDQIWRRDADGSWQLITPFAEFSHSTMSFDRADIDNDGSWEILATDMKPYNDDSETMAAWAPLMESMMADMGDHAGNPQVMENVLQRSNSDGRFSNQARMSGIDATGWSWSSKFGDLDQDGHVDLYVANGMISEELFGHLPGGELVEENQVQRNNGTGGFEPAPEWGLGSTASGRGMSMADLDQDGDLDIVVNNLNSAAQIFENRLCGGSSLQVDLRWPGSANPFAIGAVVTLHTLDNHKISRDVRTASGYLSGDPSRLHFGIPEGDTPASLSIRWPDGSMSEIEQPPVNSIIEVVR